MIDSRIRCFKFEVRTDKYAGTRRVSRLSNTTPHQHDALFARRAADAVCAYFAEATPSRPSRTNVLSVLPREWDFGTTLVGARLIAGFIRAELTFTFTTPVWQHSHLSI